ncbi:MobA/MobL family protein [Acidocella aminolytica]|nr:MobA/MobL family protein [Acidocella aminolytica]SHE30188.1 ATP-dependent exoDNAse (exonuclease V), alpha subunit, helicase superfamily I [Acidocella aminolytica 101 = DSM 11237]
MSFYHFHAKVIGLGRGRGKAKGGKMRARGARSAIGKVAYCTGLKLSDYSTGVSWTRRTKGQVICTRIMAPAGAPSWIFDHEKLWNSVEAREVRYDAQFARELELGLPRFLSPEELIELVESWTKKELVSLGMVADFSIHVSLAADGERQPHVHIILTTRKLRTDCPPGQVWGNKDRSWNNRKLLKYWRQSWADALNEAMIAHELDARVSSKSYAALGLHELRPQPKIGPRGSQARKRGSHRLDTLRVPPLPVTPLTGETVPASRATEGQEQEELQPARGNSRPEQSNELERLTAWDSWQADRIKSLFRDPSLILAALDAEAHQTLSYADIAKKIRTLTGGKLTKGETFGLIRILEESGAIIPLTTRAGVKGGLYTSETALASELSVLKYAIEIWGEDSLSRSARTVSPDHGLVSDQTERMMDEILHGGRLCTLIRTRENDEHNRLLPELGRAWLASGYRPIAVSSTTQAARRLGARIGGVAFSMPVLLRQLVEGTTCIDDRSVLIVDQAHLLSVCDTAKLLETVAPSGATMLLSTSKGQAGTTAIASPFHMLHLLGPSGADLTETSHHSNPVYRIAARLARHEQYRPALGLLGHMNALYCVEDRAAALEQAAKVWVDASTVGSVVAITAAPRLTLELNRAIQAELASKQGYLGNVLAKWNSSALENGSNHAQPLGPPLIEFKVGDQVVFREACIELGIQPGTVGILRGLSQNHPKKSFVLEIGGIKAPRMVVIDPSECRNLDLGYAITAEAETVPIPTVDHVIGLVSPEFDSPILRYVLDRHRHDIRLYLARSDFEGAESGLDAVKQLGGRIAASPTGRNTRRIYDEGVLPHSLHAAAGRSLAQVTGLGAAVFVGLRRLWRKRLNSMSISVRAFREHVLNARTAWHGIKTPAEETKATLVPPTSMAPEENQSSPMDDSSPKSRGTAGSMSSMQMPKI